MEPKGVCSNQNEEGWIDASLLSAVGMKDKDDQLSHWRTDAMGKTY